MKIVLHFSLLFYAVLAEFIFGPLKRGMTEGKPSLGDMWYNMY